MEIEIIVKIDGKEIANTKKTIETEEKKTNTEVSRYARFFDESCSHWSKDAEYNLMFLRQQQLYANDVLKKRGHLFLNDVYDMLGMPRSKSGAIVGWVYDEKNPLGDNYVDFGIYNLNNEQNRSFVNGHERSILLDFNVDGNIFDRLSD